MSNPIDSWINRQKTAIADWIRRALGLADPYAPEPEPPDPQPPQPGPGVTGSQTFLWKPVSESNGHVAILTPATYRWHGADTEKGKAGAIVMTRLYVRGGDRDGETFSSYQPLKDGKPGVNGNRIHHRGKAAGEKYGKGFDVVATLAAGGEKTWRVKDGAKRQG
jgi:hypothetical protein